MTKSELIGEIRAYLDHPAGWRQTGMPGLRHILSRAESVAPPDADREVLARIIRDETGEADEEAGFVADAILAAGFRRSEPQGEPSDAVVQAAVDASVAYYSTTWVGKIDPEPVDFDAMRAALRAAGGVR